jgi:hypothetical protein
MNLVDPSCRRHHCAEIVDDVFEALTKERLLELTRRGSDAEQSAPVSETLSIYPLKLILHNGELHLAASRVAPEVNMREILMISLATVTSAKIDRKSSFVMPLGLNIDDLIKQHFGVS